MGPLRSWWLVEGKQPPRGSLRSGTVSIAFGHARAFWFGIIACTAGVLLHLPMYLGTAEMHYRLAGMRPDAPMLVGMLLIVLGLIATSYGLIPRRLRGKNTASSMRASALDDAPIRPAHVGLLIVMALAVTVDAMKPIALSFVLPGVTSEYGLKSVLNPHGHITAALLPLAGIGGTVIGSFVWGWLGDRIGRRASILLAGVLFSTTAICGAMPGFSWNLLMCFIMGLGVGLMTYSFQLWIVTNLQHLGFTERTTDATLRDSALIGFLLTIPAALLYGFWSSKKTIIGLGVLAAAALFCFAAAGNLIAQNPGLLYALLIIPVWSVSSMTAILAAYSAEVYPTRVRSRGAGLCAGVSKAGGVVVIGLVATAVTTPSIAITALLSGVPIALAVLAIALVGPETQHRSLEEITYREDRLSVL